MRTCISSGVSSHWTRLCTALRAARRTGADGSDSPAAKMPPRVVNWPLIWSPRESVSDMKTTSATSRCSACCAA